MTALVRYLGAELISSQRWFPPMVVFAAVFGMLYSTGAGPAIPAYGATVLLLFPVSAWLSAVVANSEDPVTRMVTITAAGGWRRASTGVLLLAALCNALLVALSVLVPILVNPSPYPVSTVLIGLGAHVVAASLGIAVGLLCARPVLAGPGWTMSALITVMLIAVGLGRVPPLGDLVGQMFVPAPPAALAASLAWHVPLALVVLGAAHVVINRVGARRL
ncbi:hypothetical protein [Allokutzneria sp. NRRL B-24872]|uniref:hypothetical protein n=1 Tax=Allokutzneria sp. NRRL B-24872 TaxID=1137961 RepID=UPI000A36C851|nr:hypothetical protein [Allokutzneria sp. NRRL B-24872]